MIAATLKKWTTVPNLLSVLRLALVPVLLGLAVAGDVRGSFWTLAVAFITDLLDGFLARRLGLVSALGARLDSIADLGLFLVALLSVAGLFPDVVRQYGGLVAAALVIAAAAQTICLARYRQPVVFHTWLAKVTGFVAAVALLQLLWVGHGTWVVYVACVLGVLVQTEQLALAATLRSWQADIPSWWHAIRALAADDLPPSQ